MGLSSVAGPFSPVAFLLSSGFHRNHYSIAPAHEELPGQYAHTHTHTHKLFNFLLDGIALLNCCHFYKGALALTCSSPEGPPGESSL